MIYFHNKIIKICRFFAYEKCIQLPQKLQMLEQGMMGAGKK